MSWQSVNDRRGNPGSYEQLEAAGTRLFMVGSLVTVWFYGSALVIALVACACAAALAPFVWIVYAIAHFGLAKAFFMLLGVLAVGWLLCRFAYWVIRGS
jgi:hypothetical protein